VVASLAPVGASFMFTLGTTDSSKNLEVGYGTLPDFAKIATPGWTVQHARNAEVRLNGFPADTWIELATNTVSEVVEGLTFNLQSEGDTVISVGIDNEGIIKNVETFVDAVNSFRKVISELTKYDENKKTVDLKYAESQFEMQKGSVLTGNYGVQLLSSQLKQAVAGTAPGFAPLQKGTDGKVISGDLFTALSQIGIMTNAEQGNPMYGLLEINTVPGFKGSYAFADALAADPYAVAELFAAKEHGVADSEFFGYASHVHTMTKPGSYDVSYTVDGSGQVTSATINGKQAKIVEENGKVQIGLSSADNPPNAADGLYLDVYDLTPGATRTGTVGIRSGKVNELIGMMDGENGMLGKKGALSLLESNYEDIITNIEGKIKKEDDRLQRWENMMILKFSRLETTLGTYKKLQAQLESQLKQLSSDK
jgi:flagellar hook-associated protein 2